LGAFIRLTPKCHSKIAGRIECARGYSKLRFRRGINEAIASHLEENVKAALSREVLTINQICKFAQKPRDYKLTYSYLVALADGEDASAAKDRIEHLTKLFKQHRSALHANY
jgi:predicted naringenin-chalcone synthase